MARWGTLCALFLLTLAAGSVAAQSVTLPVAQPVHGYQAFNVGYTRLMLLDTFTGETRLLDEQIAPHRISNVAWDPAGERVAYVSALNVNILQPFVSGQPPTVFTTTIQTGDFWVMDWKPDGSQLLGIASLTDWDYEELQTMNPADGTRAVLAHYDVDTPLGQVPGQTFYGLINADWNPVYPEWIAVQMRTVPTDCTDGESPACFGRQPTVVLNLQSGQALVVDDVLGMTTYPAGYVRWSPDGRYLAVASDTRRDTNQLYILELRDNGTGWELATVASAEKSTDLYLADWLGVDDLLEMVSYEAETGDTVFYLAQMAGGVLHTTEFFRAPDEVFGPPGVSVGSWHLTAGPVEQQVLSCLFDATLPARLVAGGRGRVTFTDGTPSRLRDAPGLDGSEVTLMPEGTEFDVIGGAVCDDGYRWWQLRLGDGTVGWAAEADARTYFLEPLG